MLFVDLQCLGQPFFGLQQLGGGFIGQMIQSQSHGLFDLLVADTKIIGGLIVAGGLQIGHNVVVQAGQERQCLPVVGLHCQAGSDRKHLIIRRNTTKRQAELHVFGVITDLL